MIVIDAICDASGIVWVVKFGLKFILGFEWEGKLGQNWGKIGKAKLGDESTSEQMEDFKVTKKLLGDIDTTINNK